MKEFSVAYPWGLEALSVRESGRPEVGANDVLIRMRAVAINYRDLLTIQSGSALAAQNGAAIIPFSDGCGVVEQIGVNVTRFVVGDRVVPSFFPNWLSGEPTQRATSVALGSASAKGVGREFAAFHEEQVCAAPGYLTDVEAATLPCAALTAWRAVIEEGALKVGDTVLLLGTGGVSVFGLQFAKAAGLRTIVTSSSDQKLEAAKALGADFVINYRNEPLWSRLVREFTGGRGCDLVVEVTGSTTLHESLKSVRTGGAISVVGILADSSEEKMSSLVGSILGSNARLQGLTVGSQEMLEAMCRGMDYHKLRPVIDSVYPIHEVQSALTRLAEGRHFGKVVLDMTAG